jgi:hypothetical protein
MTSGLGSAGWLAAVVAGGGEVVDGDARWLALEQAATINAAAVTNARTLRLIASRELSPTPDALRNGSVSQVRPCVRQVSR